jgi:hypothetical protein
MNEPFDVQRLLCALPFRPISAAKNLLDGYKPPVWRYPILGPYNGFTGEQRVRTWELGTWLRRRGLLTPASACDLCGGSARLGRHSENYADVERAVTICGGCHLVLHRRFRQPNRWRVTLDRLPHVPEWALALSPAPIDLPQWLRSAGAPSDPFEWLRRQLPNDPTIEPAARADRLRRDPTQTDLFHPH